MSKNWPDIGLLAQVSESLSLYLYKYVFCHKLMPMPMKGKVHGLFDGLIDWHLCFS